MNRSGSASTSVLVSPRPMVPPAPSKRAVTSRSSGRPLKETARIVSIMSCLSGTIRERRRGILLRFGRSRPLNVLYFGDFRGLDYPLQEALDERGRRENEAADVP